MDPNAELYYNDYNLWQPQKRARVIKLLQRLQKNNVPIDGIGMQAHLGLHHPSIEQIETSIEAYADLGVKVMITELAVSVLPDSVKQQLKKRYIQLFELFKKHQDKIDRVTFWGLPMSSRGSTISPFRAERIIRYYLGVIMNRSRRSKAFYRQLRSNRFKKENPTCFLKRIGSLRKVI